MSPVHTIGGICSACCTDSAWCTCARTVTESSRTLPQNSQQEFLAVSGSASDLGMSALAQVNMIEPQSQFLPATVATPIGNENFIDTGLNSLFELMAEDIVLAHASFFSVPPGGRVPPLAGRYASTTWDITRKQLVTLGFNPDHEDPWLVLGLPKYEGPPPSPADINNRQRSGTQVASLCTTIPGKTQALRFIQSLQFAAQKCLGELPVVLRERKKRDKSSCSWRWMEVCPGFVAFLCKTLSGDGWRIALHMSNLYVFDLSQFAPNILSTEESCKMYHMLHGPHPLLPQLCRALPMPSL